MFCGGRQLPEEGFGLCGGAFDDLHRCALLKIYKSCIAYKEGYFKSNIIIESLATGE